MTTLIFTNNARTTLASGVGSTATEIVLASGTGSKFPSPASGEAFYITMYDAATQSVYEIMLCTSRVDDTLTVTRGQDGTTARAWLAGDYAWHLWNAAAARSMLQSVPSTQLTGAVTAYASTTVPDGYLECNGQSVSATTYADLYSVVGTTFGGGGGYFNVPDLRGYFVRGWDHGRGVDSDTTFGRTQTDGFASHTHTVGKGGTGGGSYVQNGPSTGGNITTSATGGTETRPKNVSLMYIIKT